MRGTSLDRVRGIVEKAQAEGRTPMSALGDVADAAGCTSALENHDYVGGWLNANGEPTFDKLLSWADGLDVGGRTAARQLAHIPSVTPVGLGDGYGLLVLEHRPTGEAFIIPYATKVIGEAERLAELLKQKKDPRAGMWLETWKHFTHA